jgi:anti-sigma-K factor RskA
VWLLKRGASAPVPARALFGVSASGDGHVRLPEDVRRGDEFLVTEEQAGGSPSGKPTTTPIMSVERT